MRCLALEIRCAIVASSTMNALAISAVVSPPTARSVRAIAEAGVSAGWQHMNSTVNVSSSSGTSRPGGSRSAATVSRSLRDCSLRHWSISRRSAVWISQPRAPAGMPSRGQCTDAASSASWTASSAASKSPYLRASTPRTCGASSRSRASTSGLACQRTPPRLTALARGSAAASATPPGPGTAEYLAAISIARSSDSTSTIM